MVQVNVDDRDTLKSAYPRDAFASDAARNELPSSPIVHGVRVGSAPDAAGNFEIERATRHAGEPDTEHFLAPVQRGEPLVATGARGEGRPETQPDTDRGYDGFLDDIIEAARRHGFRAEQSPGRDEPRLKGFHGG